MDTTLPPFLQTNPPPTAPPSSARIQALYASTSSQRTTNPTGYNANTQWWASVLEETLRTGWLNGGDDGDRLIIKVDDGLLSRLEDCQGKRPKGIGGVIANLTTTIPITLYPLPTFQSSLSPIQAPPSLTSRYIGRPLWWAVGQLNPFGSSGDKVEKEETLWSKHGKGKEYVHIPLLEQAASSFNSYISKNPILTYTDALYDLDSFREEYAKFCFPASSSSKKLPAGVHVLSLRDIEVLVRWLHRDTGVVVTDGTVIKVLDTNQIPSDHPVTEADRGVISIIIAQRKVEKQISGLEKQILESHEKAKKHLANNQKNTALSYLRSKKQLEDLLAKRVASSEQLGSVIRSIDQAKGDVEIMAAYETSTSTLESVLSNPSLSPDRIAATTDALAEAMADQEEIDQAVRIGGELAMGGKRVEVDEDELAAELADLVEEEKLAQRASEKKRLEDEERAAKSAAVAAAKKEEEEKLQPVLENPVSAKESVKPSSAESAPAQAPAKAKPTSSNNEDEQKWNERYEDAQMREDAERRRSQEERLKKDEKRIAAE
ncbi:uncharacterized protein IL334_001413 [Kwoniella shivajii]|uniref:Charged multivesicular body protein 7 n=1 Tax=Kwoniella shivajii TaxID=564305 RepID=A0ABZ1CRV7_9TREE|nr:hypothetical protein IL334_001413 [Kwoniella shivajii]